MTSRTQQGFLAKLARTLIKDAYLMVAPSPQNANLNVFASIRSLTKDSFCYALKFTMRSGPPTSALLGTSKICLHFVLHQFSVK
jgi:hypothetical protein